MLLGIGRVTSMSDSGVTQTIQYQTPLEVRDKTVRMAEFGFSSGLPGGTDVILGFLGGDRSNAVIIASNHQGYRHTGLATGETVIYDQWGQYVKLTKSGIIVEAKGQPVTVNDATTVTINAATGVVMNTPTLKVSGDIIDNAGTNSTTMKKLRDTYNEHDHQVKNVQSGSSTATSQPPGELVQ
ncbi:phage baseplate assembly protein [Sodalis ligni]|nr:phage baseplate assembly protein [Sodalis ligni]